MKFQLVYFDDQIENIEVYKLMLEDTFNVAGYTETSNYAQVLKAHKPHAILLDLHMPYQDGLILFDKIINSPNYNGCPIFFISGDVSDESRLKTIQSGAIDFFNRNINEQELKLRLMNKIKMYMQGSVLIDVGNLQLDSENFSVQVKGKPSELTLIETRILFYVIKGMPAPVNKQELISKIWGTETTPSKVNVHLHNIKIKLWNWDHELKIKDHLMTIEKL